MHAVSTNNSNDPWTLNDIDLGVDLDPWLRRLLTGSPDRVGVTVMIGK